MQDRSKDDTALWREHARPQPQPWKAGMGWSTDEGWSLETSAAVSQALRLAGRTGTPGWSRQI